MKHWIQAARLRTLPLSLSGIILGSLIAAADGQFDFIIFSLAIFTTLFLQILSNYANDYGDGIKGTDANRTGEKRMVSAGLISSKQMKIATILFAILSFVSAVVLLIYSFLPANLNLFISFIGLALLSVIAAILYTVGNSAYGYRGLGDLFVFIFFGLVAVIGTHTLFLKEINFELFLPGSAIGLLSSSVLNLNNMRDFHQDKMAHKNTIPIYLGYKNAKIYHTFLLFSPFIIGFIYTYFRSESWLKYIFLILIIPAYLLWKNVWESKKPHELDSQLKFTAFLTLGYSLLLGLGLYFG